MHSETPMNYGGSEGLRPLPPRSHCCAALCSPLDEKMNRDQGRGRETASEREREMKGSHLGSFSGFIEVTNPYLCTEAKIITRDATYSISG